MLRPIVYKSQSITVIIPCLNEEQGIEKVLTRMPIFVDQVIVVDNGSTDGAPEFARQRGAREIPMGRNAGFAAEFAARKAEVDAAIEDGSAG